MVTGVLKLLLGIFQRVAFNIFVSSLQTDFCADVGTSPHSVYCEAIFHQSAAQISQSIIQEDESNAKRWHSGQRTDCRCPVYMCGRHRSITLVELMMLLLLLLPPP
jgi:hypothetical protein